MLHCVHAMPTSALSGTSNIDESRGLPPGVSRVLQLAPKSGTDKERQRTERGLSILEREEEELPLPTRREQGALVSL